MKKVITSYKSYANVDTKLLQLFATAEEFSPTNAVIICPQFQFLIPIKDEKKYKLLD